MVPTHIGVVINCPFSISTTGNSEYKLSDTFVACFASNVGLIVQNTLIKAEFLLVFQGTIEPIVLESSRELYRLIDASLNKSPKTQHPTPTNDAVRMFAPTRISVGIPNGRTFSAASSPASLDTTLT